MLLVALSRRLALLAAIALCGACAAAVGPADAEAGGDSARPAEGDAARPSLRACLGAIHLYVDHVGGSVVDGASGPTPAGECLFDAASSNPQVASAVCDMRTGVCRCMINGTRCMCTGQPQPGPPTCAIRTRLNCCWYADY